MEQDTSVHPHVYRLSPALAGGAPDGTGASEMTEGDTAGRGYGSLILGTLTCVFSELRARSWPRSATSACAKSTERSGSLPLIVICSERTAGRNVTVVKAARRLRTDD